MITTIKLNTAAKAAPLGTSSPRAQGLVIIPNEFLFLIEVTKASYHISFILLILFIFILNIFILLILLFYVLCNILDVLSQKD